MREKLLLRQPNVVSKVGGEVGRFVKDQGGGMEPEDMILIAAATLVIVGAQDLLVGGSRTLRSIQSLGVMEGIARFDDQFMRGVIRVTEATAFAGIGLSLKERRR